LFILTFLLDLVMLVVAVKVQVATSMSVVLDRRSEAAG
jgi:hypothetical protein